MKELLHVFMPEVRRTPFYISLAGMTYPNASYRVLRDASPIAVIEYIVSGSGFVEIDGKMCEVGEGMIYFLPAGIKQHYCADKERPFKKIFMNIAGKMCTYLPGLYKLEGKNIFDGKELKALFEKVPEIINSDMSEENMQSALQGLLIQILSRLCFANSQKEQNNEAFLLKNYIDRNLNRQVSGKELAKVIFRSPDYCQKLFKKEYGVTPYAYQLERKMTRAKMLLSNTQMSVGEIGESLGYTDLHYFSNIFEAKCGMRPTAYRKK